MVLGGGHRSRYTYIYIKWHRNHSDHLKLLKKTAQNSLEEPLEDFGSLWKTWILNKQVLLNS